MQKNKKRWSGLHNGYSRLVRRAIKHGSFNEMGGVNKAENRLTAKLATVMASVEWLNESYNTRLLHQLLIASESQQAASAA